MSNKEIIIKEEKHKLLYVEYDGDLPQSAVTATFVETANKPYWRLYYWDVFANGGDKNDMKFFNSTHGGSIEDGIDAPLFVNPTEVWISNELKLNGKSKNMILIKKTKGNPFKNASESESYRYCKECNCHYDDDGYMVEMCEHIYYCNDDDCWKYYHNDEEVD